VADELRIGLTELLRKAHSEGDAEFLNEGVRALSQALMEIEVEECIGATRHQRTPGRKGQRNGYRQRIWDTRVGAVELSVPIVRAVLPEQHDEWQISKRHFSVGSLTKLDRTQEVVRQPELMAR
jgi:hypothetical protein